MTSVLGLCNLDVNLGSVLVSQFLDDVGLNLDWISLIQLSRLCRAVTDHLSSKAFLLRLAELWGVSDEPCITIMRIETLQIAQSLRNVCPDVFFLRASDEIREDGLATVSAVADICKCHPRISVYVAAHCGRGAPDVIKLPFTKQRAIAVCSAFLEAGAPSETEMRICPCGSDVAARDILYSERASGDSAPALDFSKAEVRVCLPSIDGKTVEFEWGRKWWLATEDMPALPHLQYDRWKRACPEDIPSTSSSDIEA